MSRGCEILSPCFSSPKQSHVKNKIWHTLWVSLHLCVYILGWWLFFLLFLRKSKCTLLVYAVTLQLLPCLSSLVPVMGSVWLPHCSLLGCVQPLSLLCWDGKEWVLPKLVPTNCERDKCTGLEIHTWNSFLSRNGDFWYCQLSLEFQWRVLQCKEREIKLQKCTA